MSDTPFTFYNEPAEDDGYVIVFDAEALHGKAVSPEIATVLMLKKINEQLRLLSLVNESIDNRADEDRNAVSKGPAAAS